MNTNHLTSKTCEWTTPISLYRQLDSEFHFTLDPCATSDNARCAKFYTAQDNGLAQSWAGERVFMNPPYGREIGKWIAKAYAEGLAGTLVVCLVPSRTDTYWWHRYVMKAKEIRYIRGRIKFGGTGNSAPFPSALVVFGG